MNKENERKQLETIIENFGGISPELKEQLKNHVIPLFDECYIYAFIVKDKENNFQLHFEFIEQLTGKSAIIRTTKDDKLFLVKLVEDRHRQPMKKMSQIGFQVNLKKNFRIG